MRGGAVAGGVALIIVGIIFFFISNTAVGVVSGPGGTIVGYTSERAIFLLIGVVLGIVGFIVLIAGLASSKKEQPAPPQTVVVQPSAAPKEPEVLVVCPECRARVSPTSRFCSDCGADLKPKLKVKPREVEEEEEEEPEVSKPAKLMKVKPKPPKPAPAKPTEGKPKKTGFCIYCGTELPEGSDFCPECGKRAKNVK